MKEESGNKEIEEEQPVRSEDYQESVLIGSQKKKEERE